MFDLETPSTTDRDNSLGAIPRDLLLLIRHAVRQRVKHLRAKACIRSNPTRKQIKGYHTGRNKHRNVIERFFGRIKRDRRVATRYEKKATNFKIPHKKLSSELIHSSTFRSFKEGRRCHECLVTDELWSLVEPLLPPQKTPERLGMVANRSLIAKHWKRFCLC